jgi:lipopolysaccharide/colanic/teichoic acid biosynthesis glycosyltransferase
MKRGFDIVGAVFLFILLSPLIATVAFGAIVFMGWPVLFCQPRAGLNGRVFELIKFRTMRNAVDGNGVPLSDAERLTGFGRFLRASSLDELPELWNVLKGEMSLVGPRPLLVDYLPLYSREQARRHAVRPGMTGLAQVNGRNALSWEEKFAYDVDYADHHSLALDMGILFKTLFVIVAARGINGRESLTMAPFEGSRDMHRGKKGE